MPTREEFEQSTEAFARVGLEELDERAALLKRVDVKYLVDWPTFLSLCGRLRAGHDVLEIEGRRAFAYESMYFDTPDLRCYREHEQGVIPRFKARTRLYADTNRCVFEAKLKVGDDETDKRQIDYRPEDRDVITPEAERFLAKSLADCEIEPPDELDPSLKTAFTRITFAAAEMPDRLTCDLGVRLSREGQVATLPASLVLLESKSAAGHSAADKLLHELGVEPTTVSKYRVGIELLAQPTGATPLPAAGLFAVEPEVRT